MPRYLTVNELAARLRYSVPHLRELARTGRIPSVRVPPNGRILFDPEAVAAALGGAAPAPGRAGELAATLMPCPAGVCPAGFFARGRADSQPPPPGFHPLSRSRMAVRGSPWQAECG